MKGSVVWPNIVASPQTSFEVRLSRMKWMRDKRTPKDVCGEATNIADEHWRLAWTLAPWAQFSVASEWRMPALLCVSSFSGYVYCVVLFDTGECLLYNIELISVSDSLGEWIRLLGGKFTSQVFGDLSDATPRAYTIYTSQVSFHFIHLTRWLACKDFQNVFSLFYFPEN